jgi:TolB-like protein
VAEGGGDEKASGSTAAVFISYASQDAAVANSILENLEQHGLRCWLAPRDVKPGYQYADAIVGAINEAKVVVLLLSHNAVASSHVGREIERAASKHKPIIAFRIDAATLNRALEYFLSQSQWIDAPAIGMPAALAKLVEAAGQGSGQTVTPSPLASEKPLVRTEGRAKLLGGAAVVVVVCAATAMGLHFWSQNHKVAPPPAAAAITDKSIAVLPFVDMSEKKDQEYFADGMAEETLNQLAKIPGLKVIGRNSSFQFKGRGDDLRKIGSTLGAAYVLEGSVRRSGDHLRVTAQLIATNDGAHRWSESYDRSASDVLAVQDQIAAGLARALQLEVNTTPRKAPRSPEAYDSYLRGLHARESYDQTGFEEAAANFRHALQLDPNFVPAAEALARILLDEAQWYFISPKIGFDQARAAATAALKLDAQSALAHVVIGSINLWYDWDWQKAALEMRTGLKLGPNDPAVLLFAAEEPLAIGRWDDSVRLNLESLSIDPLQASVYQPLGWTYMRMGRFAEAEFAFRRVIEISPTYVGVHYDLGTALLLQGKSDAALKEMEQETPIGGRSAGLAMAYHALHRATDADAELRKFESDHSGDMAMLIAEAHAFRGENGIALSWLERAYVQKDIFLWLVKSDPLLGNLDSDPRFKAFLRKMNLPE